LAAWHPVAVALVAMTASCKSIPPAVPDDHFYNDNFAMGKNFTQLVETNDTAPQTVPHIERFRFNCDAAFKAAVVRYKITSTPFLLSERFDKNGACTVRVAFEVKA